MIPDEQIPLATRLATVQVCGIDVRVAHLEDGRRVIVAEDMEKLLSDVLGIQVWGPMDNLFGGE